MARLLIALAVAALALGLSLAPGQARGNEPAHAARAGASSGLSLPPAVPPQLLANSRSNSDRGGGLCGGADYCWADGQSSLTYLTNDGYIGGTSLVDSYTGYLVSDGGNWPATGDTYWAHIVTAVSVIRTIPLVTGVEYVPPPHTSIALDSGKPFNAGKIRCYWTKYTLNGSGGATPGTPREFTGTNDGAGNACLNQPSPSGFGQTLGWSQMLGTLNSYSLFEVVVPLRSGKPLYGIASSSDKMRSKVSFNIEANLYPDAWTNIQKSTIALAPRFGSGKVFAAGTVGPVDPLRGELSASGEGDQVQVKVFAIVNGNSRLAGSRSLVISANGGFSTSVPVPRAATRCTVKAIWGGSTTTQKTIGC